MLSHSVVNNSALTGILGANSILAADGGGRQKKSIVADLLLTALIDAFSILVIFLLISFSANGELVTLGKGQELPKASRADMLERFPLVKVDDGKYFLEDKQVTADTLVQELLALRKSWQEMHPGEEFPGILTVQGDRRVKYETLNSIVLAGSHAGFSEIKFAVIMK